MFPDKTCRHFGSTHGIVEHPTADFAAAWQGFMSRSQPHFNSFLRLLASVVVVIAPCCSSLACCCASVQPSQVRTCCSATKVASKPSCCRRANSSASQIAAGDVESLPIKSCSCCLHEPLPFDAAKSAPLATSETRGLGFASLPLECWSPGDCRFCAALDLVSRRSPPDDHNQRQSALCVWRK